MEALNTQDNYFKYNLIALIYVMKIRFNPILLDRAGMTASIACAIHCAAVPLLITFLPLWGMSLLSAPYIEISMLLLSLCIGIISLSSSYRVHRKKPPVLILLLGFLMIAIGHFTDLEEYLVPIGGILIAIAHFLNIRSNRTCSYHKS